MFVNICHNHRRSDKQLISTKIFQMGLRKFGRFAIHIKPKRQMESCQAQEVQSFKQHNIRTDTTNPHIVFYIRPIYDTMGPFGCTCFLVLCNYVISSSSVYENVIERTGLYLQPDHEETL